MNKYSAAFLWEKGAEFYKATPLLFFTFMFVTKIVVLIEFREHNNKKSPDPTSKAQLRNWNVDIRYSSENTISAAQSILYHLNAFSAGPFREIAILSASQ